MSKINTQKEKTFSLGNEFSGPEYIHSLGANLLNGGQLVQEALQHDIIERTGKGKFRYRQQPLSPASLHRR